MASLNGFALQDQQGANWCWAACTSSVVEHAQQRVVSQCSLAQRYVPTAAHGCCQRNCSDCDRAANTYQVLLAENVVVVDYQDLAPFATIDGHVGQNQPVVLRLGWVARPSGHAVVVTGTRDDGTTQWLTVDDPSPLYGPSEYRARNFPGNFRSPATCKQTVVTG